MGKDVANSGVPVSMWSYRLGSGAKSKAPLTVVKSMRAECLDRSEIANDVRDCGDEDCELYPFRMGRNPNRAGMGGNGEAPRRWREDRSE